MKRIGILVAMVWMTLAAQRGVAAVGPIGGEFQVNEYTTESQYNPAVCRDAAGNFVVTWQSFAQDGEAAGVLARRFLSSGAALGDEFQVNTYTPGAQRDPSACCVPNGAFVIAWTSSSDQDGDGSGIFAQRFGSDGIPAGSEFQVNSYTVEPQARASVACDAAGAFVVAWNSDDQDGDDRGIFAQRFASSGVPNGTEFQVNSYTSDQQTYPSVCNNDAGDFVIAWSSYQDGDRRGVFAQRYQSDGTPIGAEFMVNSYTIDQQYNPQACCDAVGAFTIAWESTAQDGQEKGIFAQRFNTGGAVGSEFQVNSYTIRNQIQPTCCQGTNELVMAWNSYDGQDGDGSGVFAQIFNDAGRVGGEFQVSHYTPGSQASPAAACSGDDSFVIVWNSGNGQDGDRSGIFGRLFGDLASSPAPALSVPAIGVMLLALGALGVTRLRRRR